MAARHDDRTKFIVYVLWLHGLSESEVGIIAGLRRKQVAGIIGKSDYRNRSAMTVGERLDKLRELKAVRYDDSGCAIDSGMLPDRVFTPKATGKK